MIFLLVIFIERSAKGCFIQLHWREREVEKVCQYSQFWLNSLA